MEIFDGCGDIFDEKCGERENRINTSKIKQDKLVLIPMVQLVIVNLFTKLVWLWRYL